MYTEYMRDDIKGVAFDLDGTLYPNYRINIKLIPFLLKEGRLLSAFGKARKLVRKEQEISNKPFDNLYQYQTEITAKILNVPAEPLLEKIESLIYRGWEPLFKKIKLFRGAKETLNSLRIAGFKLGLLSDFPPETKLENLGLSDIWDVVHCSERCGALKPHTLPFTELASAMSLPVQNILYVGNSRSYDIAGAAKAGMKTAWIKNPLFPGKGLKMPKPDFSFSNYRQLYKFMIH
jgi:putative hydrolase of the HAD superfamily